MLRPMRRALWGYRRRDADQYIAALNTAIQQRRQEREARLAELRAFLQSSEEGIHDKETQLKSLEAEYFRLSGELNTLAARSQEQLERSQQELRDRETALWADVESDRHYAQNLNTTIQQIPDQIRSIIESIASSIVHDSPRAESRFPRGTMSRERDPNPGSPEVGGRSRG